MNSEAGDSFEAQATQALANVTIFSIFSESHKYQTAADLFHKAGHAYKLSALWMKSGASYLKAADCWQKSGGNEEVAIHHFVEAGKSFQCVDQQSAAAAYDVACKILQTHKKFVSCGCIYKEYAEYLERINNQSACMYYEKAAEYFQHEHQQYVAIECLLKVAYFAVQYNDLLKARSIFENVGNHYLRSDPLLGMAADFFFRELLCSLALGDYVYVSKKLVEYGTSFRTFAASKEYAFVDFLHTVLLRTTCLYPTFITIFL